MNDFQERKQKRIDRYKQYSGNAGKRSEDAFKEASSITSIIPMGQPILIGHHSESGHRALLKRSDNKMRKGCEESDKSKYWEDRARAAEKNHNIYSHDPEAIKKLTQNIEFCEKLQLRYKEINIMLRKEKIYKSDNDLLTKLYALYITDKEYKFIIEWNKFGWTGKDYFIIPTSVLSSNNANIQRMKTRLQTIIKTDSQLKTFKDIETDKGYITKNEEHKGLEIHFPGKPKQETIDKLKQFGFRWSRYNKCWYKAYSERNLNLAKDIIN